MLKFVFFAVACVGLAGCLNVNLKSVLPNQTYYSLDNISLTENDKNTCKNMDKTYNLNISVLSPYDGKDILIYDKDSKINVLESFKWIDLPKNMVRNAFIKIGFKGCLNIEQNMSVAQRANTIKININDMYVKKDGDYIAYIYLSYEIINYNMTRIKYDNIISTYTHANPANAIQIALTNALQNVANDLRKY